MSRHYALVVMTVFVFTLLSLATVSGRWMKQFELADRWDETGIWSSCNCMDLITGSCLRNNQFLRVVQGFSIIAALCEWFAVFVLAHEGLASRGSKTHSSAALGLFGLAIVANVITWTVFAGYFKKSDMCETGDLSWKAQGFHLSWGYGIRLIELGVLVIVLALTAINSGKVERSMLHNIVYFFAVILLMGTLLTTSGRGWMWRTNTGVTDVNDEIGLFDGCQCVEFFSSSCKAIKERIRLVEAASVFSIFFTGLLLLALTKGVETRAGLNVQRVFALVAIAASVVSLVTFTEFAKEDHCGIPALRNTQRFHWAYGAVCAAVIFQTLVLFGLVTAHAAHAECKEEAKVESATEPTA